MLVSRASSSKIEFEVQGDAVIGPVELGSAEIEFIRKSESGSVMDLRNSKNVTPLFKLAGLKSKWFADDEVGALKVNNRITPSNISSADINQEHLYLDILRSDPERPKSIIMSG